MGESVLLWYFVLLTALGPANIGVFDDHATCRRAREELHAQFAGVPSLLTPCAPAPLDQLVGIGLRPSRPSSPDRAP